MTRSTSLRPLGLAAAGVALTALAACGTSTPDVASPTGPTGGTTTPTSPTTPAQPTTSAPAAAPTYTVDLTPSAEGTTGGEPGIPMWMDGTIADAHGNATDVGQEVYGFVQDSNGNWAGMTFAQGEYRWTSFQSDGTILSSESASSDKVAVTPDGRSFAWISQFQPDQMSTRAGWQLTLAGPNAHVWPLKGTPDSDGSVVFELNPQQVKVAHPSGKVTALGSGLLSGASVASATDRIAVQTSSNADGTSCWAVVDTSGAKQADTCDYALGQFNADGSLIVGYDSQSDGLGPTRLYLLDASTLEPVARFDAPKDGFFWSETAWTGDRLLADVYSHGEWGLAWLSADGIQMQRSANKQGDEMTPPYLFGAGPLDPIAP
jgi:hypothetical protein